MTPIGKLRYLVIYPFSRTVFKKSAEKILLELSITNDVSEDEMKLFISNLWDYRYSKIRTDVCELWFEFGRIKLIMIFEMSLHASKRYGVPLSEIPRLGRWATKFSIRDSFTQSDDNATVRRKWSTVDVVFWNIVAGLTKWESKLFPVQDLRNAVILDYGCNIGVLSYLALNAGARHSVIIDVPERTSRFRCFISWWEILSHWQLYRKSTNN